AGVMALIRRYTWEDLEQPALEPVRDQLVNLLGAAALREGDVAEALARVRVVPAASEYVTAAAFTEAVALLDDGSDAAAARILARIRDRMPLPKPPPTLVGKGAMLRALAALARCEYDLAATELQRFRAFPAPAPSPGLRAEINAERALLPALDRDL